jgi:hypothetical protein
MYVHYPFLLVRSIARSRERVVFCYGLFQIQVDLGRLVCVRTHEFIHKQ